MSVSNFEIEACTDPDCPGATAGTLHGHTTFTEVGSVSVSLTPAGETHPIPVTDPDTDDADHGGALPNGRRLVVTSPGHVRTAKARASRTRAKHDRWIRELSAAGWSVVEASSITLCASIAKNRNGNPEAVLVTVACERCLSELGDWRAEDQDLWVPLPQVSAKVNGHVCGVAG